MNTVSKTISDTKRFLKAEIAERIQKEEGIPEALAFYCGIPVMMIILAKVIIIAISPLS